jgi:hypothetical protein
MINLSGADSPAVHRYLIAFQIGDEHATVRPHEASRWASRPAPRE